ncbi:glycosyltransferase family 2 protein [Paenibacillus thailandensis]|uniref:Glycosyltransferase family 2 protein n=1 Tax=Paenibacillus thailandensis TaxID=393250 RepID=A0ABW5QT76_9BACL
MNVKVSICIVTYNSEAHIGNCLSAVLRQSHAPERIVVVDNASADRTVELVKRYGEVQLIANDINNGFAGGQNQAIAAAAESDYVLVLNPDVTLDPRYIEYIVAVMENDPEVGSATGKLVHALDPSVMDSAGIGMRERDRQGYDLGAGEQAELWNEERNVFGVSGAAAVYRMAMIRDISLDGQFFDEQFFAYKEDVDVAWRAQTLGWTARYVPQALALHHRGWKKGGRRAMPLFVRRHSYQNRFFTLIKNERPGWHWLRLIPALLLIEGAKLGYIVLREPGLLACWPTIFKLFPDMRRKRKLIRDQAAGRIAAKGRNAVRAGESLVK